MGPSYAPGMTLGRRIKRARERLKLTQKNVADAFGVSPQAVSSWERDVEIPEVSKLPKLRKLLKVNYSWLLEGGDFAPPDENAPEVTIENLDPALKQAVSAGLGVMLETLRKNRRSA